jgi:hypothetical protein
MKNKYSKEALEKALTMVENGYSHSEACEGTSLNKSIIAREMRKRGNVKAQKNIDESNKIEYENFLEVYEKLRLK